MTPVHTCHAQNCKIQIPPRLFMCRKHWWMVPGQLRQAIWAAYREGQEVDKQPSMEYLERAMEAVRHVAALERSGVT